MPLRPSDPPAGTFQTIRNALTALRTGGVESGEPLGLARIDDTSLAAPHRVYFVGLGDAAQGRALESASLSGWRCLVLEDDEVLAAAHVREDDTDVVSFTHLNRGPLVQSTVRAFGVAEDRPELLQGQYEPRLLEIPALYVAALWFHGPSDFLVPLEPVPRELEPYRFYEADTFIEIVSRLARRRQAFEIDTPGR